LRSKRKQDRFVRRLETEFSAEGRSYRGISSDFSAGGLFVRTNHAFVPGTIIELTIHLPDGFASTVKGVVKRAMKTPLISLKNGMGIEIIEKDSHYVGFMKTFMPDYDAGTPQTEAATATAHEQAGAAPDFLIITCANCGVKNKVRTSRMSLGPKCGKCRAELSTP